MADFTEEQEVNTKLPRLEKVIELSSGEKLSDDVDLLMFSKKTVPLGKKAIIVVNIIVKRLENE